jgi:hypothetical protein
MCLPSHVLNYLPQVDMVLVTVHVQGRKPRHLLTAVILGYAQQLYLVPLLVCALLAISDLILVRGHDAAFTTVRLQPVLLKKLFCGSVGVTF